MKKALTAVLLLHLVAGLLLLGFWEREDLAAAWNGSGGMEGQQDEDVKKIAITFDDGPHPSYTEQLLDGLKERGVHATFFVTGEHAELHPDIIQRMQEDA